VQDALAKILPALDPVNRMQRTLQMAQLHSMLSAYQPGGSGLSGFKHNAQGALVPKDNIDFLREQAETERINALRRSNSTGAATQAANSGQGAGWKGNVTDPNGIAANLSSATVPRGGNYVPMTIKPMNTDAPTNLFEQGAAPVAPALPTGTLPLGSADTPPDHPQAPVAASPKTNIYGQPLFDANGVPLNPIAPDTEDNT
jgi:hypothetical protein